MRWETGVDSLYPYSVRDIQELGRCVLDSWT
jgi:hypothetical protein